VPQASSYAAIKTALVTRLTARVGLTSVNVLRHVPVNVDDLRTDAGTIEAIWVAGAEGISEDVVFCAGDLRFDETCTLDIVIEVHGTDSDDTQQAVDERCNELLFEVLADLAAQNDWDKAALNLDVFDYLYFTPNSYLWGEGRLQQTGVYGANVTVGLEVKARRTFT